MKNIEKTAVEMFRYDESDVTLVAKESLYKGFFEMNKYTLKHALYSGEESQTFTREIFERGDAVVVIPYDAKHDKVLFNEQFRPGALRADESPWLLEFIAGMFDENESPIEAAIREAKEEANLTLTHNELIPIMQYYPSPGGTSERVYLYLALIDGCDVKDGTCFGLPEENEDILIQLVDRTHALELLSEGKITNAATIIGLQWLAMNYQSL